ncbi:MAG: hypothetical protein ABI361_06940 [Nitrososphaera sp.]
MDDKKAKLPIQQPRTTDKQIEVKRKVSIRTFEFPPDFLNAPKTERYVDPMVIDDIDEFTNIVHKDSIDALFIDTDYGVVVFCKEKGQKNVDFQDVKVFARPAVEHGKVLVSFRKNENGRAEGFVAWQKFILLEELDVRTRAEYHAQQEELSREIVNLFGDILIEKDGQKENRDDLDVQTEVLYPIVKPFVHGRTLGITIPKKEREFLKITTKTNLYVKVDKNGRLIFEKVPQPDLKTIKKELKRG